MIATLKCRKCGVELPESEIQLSHDVPRYMGGTDKDGRHYLCKRCHSIYENIIPSIVWKNIDESKKKFLRNKIRYFAGSYFNDK